VFGSAGVKTSLSEIEIESLVIIIVGLISRAKVDMSNYILIQRGIGQVIF
jgi:hypothetical protein